MADTILQQVPLTNPFSAESGQQLNDQYSIDKLQKKVRQGNKKLRRDVVSSAGFQDTFNRFLQKQAPVENELKASAQSLSDVENPFIRRQLVSSAEQAIRGRRANIGDQFANVLAQRLQGEQISQQARQTDLTQALGERNEARQFASQQYLGAIQNEYQKEAEQRQYDNSLKQYRAQLDIQKELGIGEFAPRGGGGGGGSASLKNPQVITVGDMDYVYQNGQLIGSAPAAKKESLADQLIAGLTGDTSGLSSGSTQKLQPREMSRQLPSRLRR